MNFLTILAGFLGGAVWVRADYYLEVKTWLPPNSNRQQPAMDTIVYECRGLPIGTRAVDVTQSRCTSVTDYTQKVQIHATATFYNVFRPDRQDHVIRLGDRGLLRQDNWSVGYLNNAMDHPAFGPPIENDFWYFQNRVATMSVPQIVPMEAYNSLASYYAQASVINLAENPDTAAPHFTVFTDVLQNIIDRYNSIGQQATEQLVEQLRIRVTEAMKVALQKMIDPCSVLLPNEYQATATAHCATYCNFLNVVDKHFGTALGRCSPLVGGRCQSVVCNCERRITTAISGCRSMVTPMRRCNNAMRSKLNL